MTTWKDIPIFISSTFNDMHAERDYLVKNVFPELAEWCERRKLRLIDIDLRWGVTKEDSETNKTVRKCLEGIDGCRPFFLCFLGQRRGWVPSSEQIGDARSAYRDDEHFFGSKSVTEIEIEHALLSPMYRLADDKKPAPAKHALFFFRNEPSGENWDEAHRRLYRNDAVADEGGNIEETDRHLADFKSEVKKNKSVTEYNCHWDADAETPELLPPKKNYDNLAQKDLEKIELAKGRLVDFSVPKQNLPDDLIQTLKGEFPGVAGGDKIELKYVVIVQLMREILEEYPERENPVADGGDPYALDLEQQEIFIHNAVEGFVPVPDIPEKLDEYAAKTGVKPPLLLAAEAGLGKTTLLAKWVSEKRAESKNVIFRFCGASDLSADQYALWDSILRQCGLKPPVSFDELKKSFWQLLSGTKSETIIIIDAIDQLPDGRGMPQWLPRELPSGISIILSLKINKGESMDYSPVPLKLPPVNVERKTELIASYLKKRLKVLDEYHIKEICGIDPEDEAQKSASANPLYLKILLSELRVFGAFEQLADQIKLYGRSPLEAFDYVLERLSHEQAYDILDPQKAVPLLFGLLSAARGGLYEDELAFCFALEFSDEGDAKIRGTIRYFVRQVRPFMARRGGRVDFLYDELRGAALTRFNKLKIHCNRLLMECFLADCDPDKNNSFTGDNLRALVEFGYHTAEHDYCEGEKLYSRLTYLDARCSKTPIQPLLTEIHRFKSDICRDFEGIILRHQALLSEYPNALFSVCRAEKSSSVSRQANALIADGSWTKLRLDIERMFVVPDETSDDTNEGEAAKDPQSLTLKLVSESGRRIFTPACAFSPDTATFVFAETLGQLRVFNTNTFEMLPCIIHVHPTRIVSVRFSPDQKYLALMYEDARIELFRLKYNSDGLLSQAVSLNQELSAYKPRRGFSSYGFSGGGFYFQPDAHTVREFDLTKPAFTDITRTENPAVLDAVISLNEAAVFSLREGMYSGIYLYSQANETVKRIQVLEGVFTQHACALSDDCFATAVSDDRVLIVDPAGNIIAERKMTNPVKAICKFGQKLLVLCHHDEIIIWDYAANRTQAISADKNEDRHMNMLAANGNTIFSILGSAVVKFETVSGYHETKSNIRQIIAMNEIPELTVAARDQSGNITVQTNGFCSKPIRLEDERIQPSVCITSGGTYLLSEFGQGYYLPPKQSYFQPIKEIGRAIRILKSFASPDGCVYYIDNLWRFCCGQSSFSYDLSSYGFEIADVRFLGPYMLLFGIGSGMSDASTGHVPLSDKLLIFESVRPGLLSFYGEQSFSSAYGVPVDAAFHEETKRIYLMFNTPHSAKSQDLLHVCFGTKEELTSGGGRHADINLGRTQNINPSTACAADSYLVCYRGNIFAYDAATLAYQAALAVNGSFNRLQASRGGDYALALCGGSSEIKKVIPSRKEK
ncbi:MAG TPA: hypothetical protein DEQ02_07875 [Ruminococcaceae bacterium]|nr:hypothetical protein [Oscillospiraceae bacterium]